MSFCLVLIVLYIHVNKQFSFVFKVQDYYFILRLYICDPQNLLTTPKSYTQGDTVTPQKNVQGKTLTMLSYHRTCCYRSTRMGSQATLQMLRTRKPPTGCATSTVPTQKTSRTLWLSSTRAASITDPSNPYCQVRFKV